jgi:ribosomal protein S10
LFAQFTARKQEREIVLVMSYKRLIDIYLLFKTIDALMKPELLEEFEIKV